MERRKGIFDAREVCTMPMRSIEEKAVLRWPHAEIGFNGTETVSREPYLSQAKVFGGPNLQLTDVESLCAFALRPEINPGFKRNPGNAFARGAFHRYRSGDHSLSGFRPYCPVAAVAMTDEHPDEDENPRPLGSAIPVSMQREPAMAHSSSVRN